MPWLRTGGDRFIRTIRFALLKPSRKSMFQENIVKLIESAARTVLFDGFGIGHFRFEMRRAKSFGSLGLPTILPPKKYWKISFSRRKRWKHWGNWRAALLMIS